MGEVTIRQLKKGIAFQRTMTKKVVSFLTKNRGGGTASLPHRDDTNPSDATGRQTRHHSAVINDVTRTSRRGTERPQRLSGAAVVNDRTHA